MSTISTTSSSSSFSFNTNNLVQEFAQQSNASENGGALTAADAANLALTLNSEGNSDANFWATMADGGTNGASLIGNNGLSLSDLTAMSGEDGTANTIDYQDVANQFGASNVAAQGNEVSMTQLQTTAGTSTGLSTSSSSTTQLLEDVLGLVMMMCFSGSSSGASRLFGSSTENPFSSLAGYGGASIDGENPFSQYGDSSFSNFSEL